MVSDTPSIAVRGLTKRFGGRTAVNHVEFQVDPGQVFGFLGPNGAGKSTTIRMLLGLVTPTSGDALLLGYDVRSQRLQALSRVGSLVEGPAFYGYLSGSENIRLFARLSGRVRSGDIARALSVTGLGTRSRDKVKTYSHGMRQRLGIACALVPQPEVLILDEPTNGMDPQGVREVRQLIRTLAHEHGITIFLSSHLLYEVEQVCTHVAVIAGGKMLAHGSVEQLLGRGFGPVEFEVDDPERAEQLLRVRFGVEPLWSDTERVAFNIAFSLAADYNRLLVDNGLRVTAIERRQRTLEDYYLDLVRSAEQEQD